MPQQSPVVYNPRVKPRQGTKYNPRYWDKFGGQAVLDLPLLGPGPGGGSKDYSKFGFTSSPAGTPKWISSVFGSCVNLNGSTDYFLLPNNISLPPPFSMGVFCRPSNSQNQYPFNIQKTGGQGGGIYYNNGFYRFDKTAATLIDSGIAFVVGSWSLCIWVMNADWTMDLYIDGVHRYHSADITPVGSSSTRFNAIGSGGFGSPGANPFAGDIGYVIAFNNALTAAQIAAFYARPWSRFSPSSITYFAPSSSTNIYNETGSGEVVISGSAPLSLKINETGSGTAVIGGSASVYVPGQNIELEPHIAIIEYKKPSYHYVNEAFAELVVKKPTSAKEINTIDSLKRIIQ